MKYDGKKVWCVWLSFYRYETHTELVIQQQKRLIHIFEDDEVPVVFSTKDDSEKSLEKCKKYVLKKLKREIPRKKINEYSFVQSVDKLFDSEIIDIRFRHKSHILLDNTPMKLTPLFYY